jgi:hypothetical protein
MGPGQGDGAMDLSETDVSPESATIRCRYCRRQIPLATFLRHNRRDKNRIQRMMSRYPHLSPMQAIHRWRRMVQSGYVADP